MRGHTGYTPSIPARVDHQKLIGEIAEFVGSEQSTVRTMFQTYLSFHRAKGYEQTLGELKTLCFEEAFVIYCLLAARRPRTILATIIHANAARMTAR